MFFYSVISALFLFVWLFPLQGTGAFRSSGTLESGQDDFRIISPVRSSRGGGDYVRVLPGKPVFDFTLPGSSGSQPTRPEPIDPDPLRPQPSDDPLPDAGAVQPPPSPPGSNPVQPQPPANSLSGRVRRPANSNPIQLQPLPELGPVQPSPSPIDPNPPEPQLPPVDPVPVQPQFPAESEAPTGLTSQEARAFALLNEFRAENNLPPLKSHPELLEVARLKARDLVENNYFGHVSPTYGSIGQMLGHAGISFSSAAENLSKAGNIDQAHLQLVYSTEGHRQIMLGSNYDYVGIGILPLKNVPGIVMVQLFIKK